MGVSFLAFPNQEVGFRGCFRGIFRGVVQGMFRTSPQVERQKWWYVSGVRFAVCIAKVGLPTLA